MPMNPFTWLSAWLCARKDNPASAEGEPLGPSRGARLEQLPVGSLVIACPNEWQPMVIGTIKGYEGRFGNIPFVTDWVSGEEVMCFAPLTVFSDEAFALLVLMNPYERFNHVAMYAEVELGKPKRGNDIPVEEYISKVGVGLAALLEMQGAQP